MGDEWFVPKERFLEALDGWEKAADMEAMLRQNVALRAFTAPDEATGPMLTSLDDRIRDAVRRADQAEAQLARLREALEAIAHCDDESLGFHCRGRENTHERARAALTQEDSDE